MKEINVIIVGVDWIVVNGDIVNKIGIMNLVILVKYFNILFYVVVLLLIFDVMKEIGVEIIIEERDEIEVMKIFGK